MRIHHRVDEQSAELLFSRGSLPSDLLPARPAVRSEIRRDVGLADFSACAQNCIVSAAPCTTDSSLDCICQDAAAEDTAAYCMETKLCSTADLTQFNEFVFQCFSVVSQPTFTHHTKNTSPAHDPTPTSSPNPTSVQSPPQPTTPRDPSSSTAAELPPTPSTSSSSGPLSSLPSSLSSQPASLSPSLSGTASSTLSQTSPPLSSSTPGHPDPSPLSSFSSDSLPSSVIGPPAASTSVGTAVSHGPSQAVMIIVLALLGFLALVVAVAVSVYCLRRRRRRPVARRADVPSSSVDRDIGTPGPEVSSPGSDAFEGRVSSDKAASTGDYPSPTSSVSDISATGASVGAAPHQSPPPSVMQSPMESPPLGVQAEPRAEERAYTTPVEGTPPPSRDAHPGDEKPVVGPSRIEHNASALEGGPLLCSAPIVRPPPIFAPPEATPVRVSHAPRGSRFVTVLMEVPDEDEEEHELPPPYRPRPRGLPATPALGVR